MNKKIPYVLCGVIVALCAAHATHAYHNPYAVFSIGAEKTPLPCIPFSQLAPITFENRPSLRSFEEDIHRSMELEKKELALAFPQIALTGLAAKTDFQSVLELPYPAREVHFSVNQLLWSFAGPIQQYRIQRSSTSAREEDERYHRTVIRLESEQTFLDTYLFLREQEFIQALDTSSQSVFSQAQTNYRVGFLSDTQWKKTESDFVTSQMQVLRYQDNVQYSYSYLERALSIPLFASSTHLPKLLMDTGLLTFTVNSLENYLENAIHLRHDLASKAWEVDRAQKASALLINKYAPELTFSFNVNRFNFDTRADGILKQLTFQLAINASWQFDSFSSAHESSATDAELISLKMQQLDLSLAIQRDVKAAYYQLQALLKDVEAVKAQYLAAEALFQTQEHQFEVGQISEVDYAVAITNFKAAQFAIDQRTVAAEKQYRELLFACGYPPEFESSQNLWSHK